MDRRFLIATASIVALLVGAIGVVYLFGTPQAPPTPANSQLAVAPQASGTGGGAVAEPVAGEVPPPDPNVPLAIQIPGCKCHSDDPKIVEEHSKYRMNQCGGCHGGKTPTGQR